MGNKIRDFVDELRNYGTKFLQLNVVMPDE